MNKYFVEIYNSLFALPTKNMCTKLNVQHILMISQYNNYIKTKDF